MKNKLLVTGGAGFIGSRFIQYMLEKYSEMSIVNLDSLTYAGSLANNKDIQARENYSFVQGDITNSQLVHSIFEQGIDLVVHCAAESHVDRSIDDPHTFVKTNVLGTQVLLDAARTYGVQKFLHVSTDEVYGTLGKTGLFHEETPLEPNSPYSASKAGADFIVRAYHETYQLPVNITRCSNNFGPYQYPEKFIPVMIRQALNDQPLPIYGDGLYIRDWIYVEDHCRALDFVLHKGEDGEIYNIGANNELRNIDLVRIILNYLNKPEALIEYVSDRPGHDRRYALDVSKIRKELGWKPVYSFSDAIEKTINWYKETDKQ